MTNKFVEKSGYAQTSDMEAKDAVRDTARINDGVFRQALLIYISMPNCAKKNFAELITENPLFGQRGIRSEQTTGLYTATLRKLVTNIIHRLANTQDASAYNTSQNSGPRESVTK